MENQRELTFGEKAVGLTFNPSFDTRVDEAKVGFAKLIDMVGDPTVDTEKRSYLYNIIRTAAISTCIAASMAVVKFITWKD